MLVSYKVIKSFRYIETFVYNKSIPMIFVLYFHVWCNRTCGKIVISWRKKHISLKLVHVIQYCLIDIKMCHILNQHWFPNVGGHLGPSSSIAVLALIYHNHNKQFYNLHTCTNILVYRNHSLWFNTSDV